MGRRDAAQGPHGIVVVDKPSGLTSHDVVARARRHFGTRRVGHAGTLDPMATGVLVLLLGEATKLSNYLTGHSKRYAATIRFGRATDSLDADGSETARQDLPDGWLSHAQLRDALQAERLRAYQVPPTVSAIKVGGKRSYKLHRQGTPTPLDPRQVSVQSIALESYDDHRVSLVIHVSKGYYVRSLARDLGAALGVPAHLETLRRLSSGNFEIQAASRWPFEETARVSPLPKVLPHLLPTYQLAQMGVERARQGKPLFAEHFGRSTPPDPQTTLSAWTDDAGNPVALGHCTEGEYRVTRGFIPLPPGPLL